jgi:hypothetical protein
MASASITPTRTRNWVANFVPLPGPTDLCFAEPSDPREESDIAVANAQQFRAVSRPHGGPAALVISSDSYLCPLATFETSVPPTRYGGVVASGLQGGDQVWTWKLPLAIRPPSW